MSTKKKKLRGVRPGRVNELEPRVAPQAPYCPQYLEREDRTVWRKYAGELKRSGMLTFVDGPVFVCLCQALGELERVSRQLKGMPTVTKTPVNPVFRVLK